MTDSLYYYNSRALFDNETSLLYNKCQENPELNLFSSLFKVLGRVMTFNDRTGTLTTPIKTMTIPGLELPSLEPETRDYEELCDIRAKELLDQVQQSGKRMAVMYSGGIDSTLILVSLLKIASREVLREKVIVLLSDVSIRENPNFFHNHVLPNFEVGHSLMFPYYFGDDRYLIVTGDANDQLFVSQILIDFSDRFGLYPWDIPVSKSLIVDHFSKQTGNPENSERLFELLNRVCNAAPITIDNIFLWFWWLNFSCKWQSVMVRPLCNTYAPQRPNVRLFENFTMFFLNPYFQRWSMSNLEKLIGNNINDTKPVCKKIIGDFTKDENYATTKLKIPSLMFLIRNLRGAVVIDSSMNILDDFNDKYIQTGSSFSI